MIGLDQRFDDSAFIAKVRQIAKEFGADGNIFDDDQRIRRDPMFEEKHAFTEIFKAVAELYWLVGDYRNLAKRIIWNAVMNSTESKQLLGIE